MNYTNLGSFMIDGDVVNNFPLSVYPVGGTTHPISALEVIINGQLSRVGKLLAFGFQKLSASTPWGIAG